MIVGIAALDKLGVPIASAVTILGTIGLAVGLALKDSLSNIASGVMLIVLRPFRVRRHRDRRRAGRHRAEQASIFQTGCALPTTA
jgi:hypothetical protein